jgi:hypothetical protein
MADFLLEPRRSKAGAAAAASALMGAPPDGYTFIVTDGSIVSTNPVIFKQLTYNPKDIVPGRCSAARRCFWPRTQACPFRTCASLSTT